MLVAALTTHVKEGSIIPNGPREIIKSLRDKVVLVVNEFFSGKEVKWCLPI